MTEEEIKSTIEQILDDCSDWDMEAQANILNRYAACDLILSFIKSPKMKEFLDKTQDV